MSDELAALGVAERGGDGDLDAELVRPMGLAFADAFDFRRVQGVNRRANFGRRSPSLGGQYWGLTQI
jgi:hypothetical protein